MFNGKDFGEGLKKLRKNKGYSQLELATDLTLDQSYLGLIERNKRIPSIDITISIVNYFGLSVEDFYNIGSCKNHSPKEDIINKINLLSELDCEFLYKTLVQLNKVVLQDI